jgi:hypothetical protein
MKICTNINLFIFHLRHPECESPQSNKGIISPTLFNSQTLIFKQKILGKIFNKEM